MARGLLDVLREFSDNENDFISVMETVARMSEDGGSFICILIYLVTSSQINFQYSLYVFQHPNMMKEHSQITLPSGQYTCF